MKILVLLRYLFGSHKAILEIAASRWAIVFGALLVLGAGVAREYDGEDLIHEPWHVLRPLAASLLSGTVLYLVIHVATRLRAEVTGTTPPPFSTSYRSFMGLFWLTAPMAWLYAIPYERFMSPVDAMEANLWMLALVSAWRVILMTRVIAVVNGIGFVTTFFLVMVFADAAVFAAVTLMPTPIIDVMGGIRHSDRDAFVAGITMSLTILSVITSPVWIIGALISARVIRPQWPELKAPTGPAPYRGLFLTAVFLVVISIPLLLVGQPEQMNRFRDEGLLKEGRVGEAFALMSARSPSEYPPHWNPPPRLGYRESVPDLAEVRAAMDEQWPADWIATLYVAKINRELSEGLVYRSRADDFGELVEYLEQMGRTPRISRAQARAAEFLLEHDETLSEGDRVGLEQIVRLSGINGFDGLSDDHLAGLLVGAIRENELDVVRELLETGLDPNDSNWRGRDSTPLAAAAVANNIEAIALLLDHGAEIDLSDGDRFASPAHYAAYHGSTEALALLLDRGADPHVFTGQEGSLIYAAASKRHRSVVQMLLDRDLGIDLQRGRARDKATPLHMAYRTRDFEMVRILIEAGADPDAQTTDGRTPSQFKP